LPDAFTDINDLKQEDALSLFVFTSAQKYIIRNIEKNRYGFELNGTHHILVCADDINVLDET
jgi:hypothetical protein